MTDAVSEARQCATCGSGERFVEHNYVLCPPGYHTFQPADDQIDAEWERRTALQEAWADYAHDLSMYFTGDLSFERVEVARALVDSCIRKSERARYTELVEAARADVEWRAHEHPEGGCGEEYATDRYEDGKQVYEVCDRIAQCGDCRAFNRLAAALRALEEK